MEYVMYQNEWKIIDIIIHAKILQAKKSWKIFLIYAKIHFNNYFALSTAESNRYYRNQATPQDNNNQLSTTWPTIFCTFTSFAMSHHSITTWAFLPLGLMP